MKRTKKRQDIKSKLIAAICMLMVSVIMLASSSYAWFTLSTAPEVKGLQANVGANGNLEIALLGTANSYNTPGDISSAVGDSSAADGKNALSANLTWGNLIDLSHESYGLGMITLKPAALNTTGDVPVVGQTIAAQMLKVPMYGADGRVTKLDYENTILAPYNATKKAFSKVDTDTATNATYNPAKDIEYGLRAIGSSTNRSIREITYDTNMSQANQMASIAKSDAVTSLTAYGAVLADIGIQGGMYGDSTTFDKNVLDNLQAMLNSIVGYTTNIGTTDEPNNVKVDGITDNIQAALEYYAMAAVASGWNETDYANDEAFTTAMEGLTVAEAYDLIGDLKPVFENAAAELLAVKAAATTAQSQLTNLKNQNKATYTFAELKDVIRPLFDTSSMTVCGMTVADIKAEDGKSKLMTAYGEYNNQIVVDMKGGIYSEIADLTDTFSGRAKLDIPELGPTQSIMQANRTEVDGVTTSPVMSGINTQLAGKLPPKGASSNPVISDAYGYVVDMAFRTNASNSNLLLQTEAEARIDGADDDTMGGGSTMTFTAIEGFSTDKMKALMGKINVVFFTNDGNNTILAVAGLDTASATVTGTTVTAPLKIKTDSGFATDANAVIYDNMPTNTPVKISALVYLDGTSITNGDVGTGALSMTGRLNLQFSSSATLTPMDYSAGFAPANPVVDATTP